MQLDPLIVREGKPVPLPPGLRGDRIRQKLLRATARLPHDVFTVKRGVLRAGNAVGVVDVGEVQVTVVPKATGGKPPAEFLTDLLFAAGVTPRLAPLSGRMTPARDDIPDALARAFAEDILSRLTQAVPRRYAEREEDSSVLRGRPDFSAYARRPFGRQHLLPIRYTPLQQDNQLSRVVRATVTSLGRFATSATTSAVLRECDSALLSARLMPLGATAPDRIVLGRYEQQWVPTVELAKALVAGSPPSPVRAGGVPGLSLLFSLNDLFEAVLRRFLPMALEGSPLMLEPGGKRLRLLRDARTGAEFLSMRPDYVFGDSNGIRAVGDAKWKPLTEREPGHGLSSADAYQLGIYMARHGVSRGVLFFPRQDWMPRLWRRRAELMGNAGSEVRIVGVDVSGIISRNTGEAEKALDVLRKTTLACVCSQASQKGTSVAAGTVPSPR